jgi:transposase
MKGCPKLLDFWAAWRYPLLDISGRHGRILQWHAAAHHPAWFSFAQLNARNLHTGNGPRRSRLVWLSARALSYCGPRAWLSRRLAGAWEWGDGSSANGSSVFSTSAWQGLPISLAGADSRRFPPEVAVHLVKMACERPDTIGRSLSQWDCTELARLLEHEGIVDSISPETVRRILAHHKLKPWRHHLWLSPRTPRDAEFCARVSSIVDLYTRPLRDHERVLCVDEKTSLQPRSRLHTTRPAKPGVPNRVEHEYRRSGALNLLAAFDTRTGHVYGQCHARKRQHEFIAFLAHIDASIPTKITTIHIICDNARAHHGQDVRRWLISHPRFVMHFTPVHCSWLNQVEQWFSILQRKRLRIVDFASVGDLQAKLEQFMAEWNEVAHPFNWTTKSVAKVMADAVPAAA